MARYLKEIKIKPFGKSINNNGSYTNIKTDKIYFEKDSKLKINSLKMKPINI